MAGSGTTSRGGSLLPSFQSMLTEALKAEGLIPMTTGITKLTAPAADYSAVLAEAGAAVDRASVQFGSRASDRYSTGVGSSYRDERFAMIASLENIKTTAYNDSGNIAVGLGFNMDKPGARDVWSEAFGSAVSFDSVRAGKKSITPAQAKQLFDHDVVYYERVVDNAAGSRPLTQNQRLALVSVAYSTPARVSSWGPVIQSGDDAALMDLILTQSFRENHPQANGLRKRRYVEASIFAGTAEASQLMPAFDEYLEAVQVDPQTGIASVNGEPVVEGQQTLVSIPQTVGGTTREGVAIPVPMRDRTITGSAEAYAQSREVSLAGLEYGYGSGTKRNLPVREELVQNIQQSVTAVYGGDYRATVISGTQNPDRSKASPNRRHDTELAADVFVYAPDGKRLQGDELLPLAQHWLASNTGSVGFPVGPDQSLHLDLIGGSVTGSVPLQGREGRFWYYGTPTSAQRTAINAGMAGTRPSYALDPEIVAQGLVPPESLPEVASMVDTTAPRTAPTPATASASVRTQRMLNQPTNGAPEPASPSTALKVNRALNQPAHGAPSPAIQSDDMRQLRNPEISGAAQRAQVNRLPDITGTQAPTPAVQSERLRLARVTVARRPNAAPVPFQRPASVVRAAQQVGRTTGVRLTGVGTLGVSGAAPRSVKPSKPLSIVVSGAGTAMAPAQVLQARTGMSAAQAYDTLNAAARRPTNAAERMEAMSGSGGGGASSLTG